MFCDKCGMDFEREYTNPPNYDDFGGEDNYDAAVNAGAVVDICDDCYLELIGSKGGVN